MRNAMIAVGIIVGGTVLFLGVVYLILSLQGRLEGESRKLLSEHPVLGAFISAPETETEAGDENADSADRAESKKSPASGKSKAGSLSVSASDRQGGKTKPGKDIEVPRYLNAPKSFSNEELQDLLDTARKTKELTENEWSAIEVEKLNLERLREDLAERKSELEKTMGEVALAKSELDAARTQFREEVLTIEDNEDKMIRKLAEMYENIKPPETAAGHFDDMDIDQVVKILVVMDATKAAKILPYMSAERVKVVTEKLSRFQERKKSEKK
ncbi:MAG: hypothetical protein ABIK28_09225 [Planctomycetota bacterium]